MNTFQRIVTLPTIFVASYMLIACDAVLDCVDNDGPVFDTTSLPSATLNQVYNARIKASVRNEPFDGRFDYDFAIIRGALPPGISTEAVGQELLFLGAPTQLGTFDFELNVFVDDGLNAIDSGLCFRNRSSDFSLTVEQEQ